MPKRAMISGVATATWSSKNPASDLHRPQTFGDTKERLTNLTKHTEPTAEPLWHQSRSKAARPTIPVV